jgi:AsmA protein
MRTYKILGGLVLALVALLGVALLAAKLLIDPNDYKPRIVAAVRQATGRELVLQGDLTLSEFHRLALELGPASLGNPPGFDGQAVEAGASASVPPGTAAGGPSAGSSGVAASSPSAGPFGSPSGVAASRPFVSFTHASVRAKLLPLLFKRLEVGRVEVDGLDLRLLRNAEGKGNWSGFGTSKVHAAPAAAESGGTERGSGKEDPVRTEGSGGTMGSGATAGAPRTDGAPGTEGAAGTVGTGGSEATGGPAGTGGTEEKLLGIEDIKITHARVSYQNVTLSNLNLETGSFVDNAVVPVTLHVEFERDPPAPGSIEDGAAVQGSLDARLNFSADPAAEHYAVAALNLNCLVNLPGKPRPLRFNVAAPGIDVNLKSQTLTALAFALDVAGAQVSGSVEGTDILDSPALRGSLKLEPLVVREYLPRVGISVPRTRDPKAYSLVAGSADFDYAKDSARLEKLQATLDDTHLRGNVALALDTRALTFDLAVDTLDADRYLPPADPSAPKVGSVPADRSEPAGQTPGEEPKPLAANGTLVLTTVHLAPLDLGNVRVTVSTNERVLRIFPLKAEVDGGQYSGDIALDQRGAVPVLSLDEHLSGIDVGKLLAGDSGHLRLSGHGNVNLKASGRGAGADAIVKTLNGRFEANVADGAVEGLDLDYELTRGEALLNRKDMPGVRNSRRTTFDAFKVSAAITNGVAETHDLTISSKAIKVTGEGSVNLAAKSVDFSLLVDTLRTLGGTPLQIPVKVTGPMSDPNVIPDIEALAKGQLKQKLEDVLKDKLQGLFGKP